jgi:hypothetical protein
MRRSFKDADFKLKYGVVPVPGSIRQGAEFTRQMMWYWFIPALASALIVGDMPDDDDDDGWWEWMASRSASYGLASVFGVRDIAYLFNDFTPGSPYARAIQSGKYGISTAEKVISGEKELTDPEVAARLIRTAATVVPLAGAGQYAKMLEGWSDDMENNNRNLFQIAVEGKEWKD